MRVQNHTQKSYKNYKLDQNAIILNEKTSTLNFLSIQTGRMQKLKHYNQDTAV